MDDFAVGFEGVGVLVTADSHRAVLERATLYRPSDGFSRWLPHAEDLQRGGFRTETPAPRCQFSVAALRLVSRWQIVESLLADIELTGGPKVGESFSFFSEVFQKQTEIVMSIGKIRITGEGFLIAVDRFSGTFEIFEQDAEIEVRGCLARCESCGGAVVRLGFAQLSGLMAELAQIQVSVRDVWVDLQCPTVSSLRFFG